MKKSYEIERIYCAEVPSRMEQPNLVLLYLTLEQEYKILASFFTDKTEFDSIASLKSKIIKKTLLTEYLKNKDMEALLYDAKHNLKQGLFQEQAMQLFDVIRFERYLTEEQKAKLKDMCSIVTAYLIIKLNIPKKSQKQFSEIIKSYLMLDAITSSRSSVNWFVTKENEVIDYKLLRTFRGCGLNIDTLKKSENFKVRVSNDNIFVSENNQEEQLIYGKKPLEPQKIIKIR